MGVADTAAPEEARREVLRMLTERGWHLTAAESCTGGLFMARMIDVPGASAAVGLSFVTYSNEAKEAALGVSGDTLRSFGAVSSQTAREMAEGAARAAKAEAAVAITGIAGPDGGTAEKPVGLVYTGVYLNGEVSVMKKIHSGSRAQIRSCSADEAACFLLDCMKRGSSW